MVGGCSGGWQSNFGNEYCYDMAKETYAAARNICESRNATLASITSDQECDYVASLMSVHFYDTIRYEYKDDDDDLAV